MVLRPGTLIIETTNRCQLNCDFCPRDKLTRPLGFMSDEVFERCVEQAKDFKIKTVNPFFFGEPFIDKKIYERVERLVGSGFAVALYSNLGVPIDEEKISLLRGVHVVVSFAPGADYDIRRRNMYLLQKENIGVEIHAVSGDVDPLGFMQTETREAALLSKEFKVQLKFFGKYNWRGNISSPMPVRDGICKRPSTSMVVLWDGRISLCCMDYDGEATFGNIMERSLKDVWNSPEFVQYLTQPKSRLEFCKNCNMQLFSDPRC